MLIGRIEPASEWSGPVAIRLLRRWAAAPQMRPKPREAPVMNQIL